MSIYTKETLNARMAEVMGWIPDNSKLFYINGAFELVMESRHWQPTEDANQALHVLEKWCKDGGYRDSSMRFRFDKFYDVYLGDDANTHTYVGKHASLPVAICLAIASAEDGQQATLEGE